jgi:cbb3-type cytochrome oxidase subunit 3
MNPKKNCLRCNRLIDAEARICPFCNQEQMVETLDGSTKPVKEPSPPSPSPIWGAGSERSRRRKIILSAAGGVLLIATFFIGWIVYALGQQDRGQRRVAEEIPMVETEDPTPLPDLTLVADHRADPNIDPAYTSRLGEELNAELPEEFQRRDATALPWAVYQRVAAEEEIRETERRARLVDPREVTEAARPRQPVARVERDTESPQPPARPLGEIPGAAGPVTEAPTPPSQQAQQAQAPEAAGIVQTKPKPVSQPLPSIVSRVPGTIRLNLIVGANGRVQNVEVLQQMPGVTPRVVAAVREWRFQPATIDGRPIESNYQVEIVVRPNR